MNVSNILRIIGLSLVFYSLTMLPPVFIAFWYEEKTISIFLIACAMSIFFGLLLWFPNHRSHREVRQKEGFLIVTLLWIFLCLSSSIPFLLSNTASFVDSVFEATSGLTTTGATVLIHLDTLPKSIMYYRQQLQFIGGGGIILFAIAILPMLGVGGMQLFRAEMAGPFKEDKLTPRIAQTAKTLWYLYVGLVCLCALCFWLTGMDVFDAVTHSFATVSTGGFSTHDQSFLYFNNAAIEWVAILFMFLGAVNFALHFMSLRHLTLRHYWQDVEFRTYFIYLLFIITLVMFTLWQHSDFHNFKDFVTPSIFQVVTFCTTTGFSSVEYAKFPSYVPILLVLISLIGGCAGSTAGGIKMIRALLMNKQSVREIQRLIHPNGYYVIKLGYSRLQHRTLDAVWGFFGVYIASFCLLLLFLLATGLDFLTAFSGLAAALSSGGLGLGAITDNFKSLNDAAKIILSFAMLAGRLEFFTILVLLSPGYWRN